MINMVIQEILQQVNVREEQDLEGANSEDVEHGLH